MWETSQIRWGSNSNDMGTYHQFHGGKNGNVVERISIFEFESGAFLSGRVLTDGNGITFCSDDLDQVAQPDSLRSGLSIAAGKIATMSILATYPKCSYYLLVATQSTK